MSDELRHLVRRLGIHKRRIRYWANLPGFYGPSRKALRERRVDEMYELACDDASSIAHEIEKLTGQPCPVIDRRRTLQIRFNNPSAPPAMVHGKATDLPKQRQKGGRDE